MNQYIQGLLGDAELPMFSQLLVELLSLPIDDSKAARKLFEMVGEDYGLTCKVLRTANSYHFNRSNRPIDNLTQAIFVLGVDTVRNLASTLMCFESFQRSTSLQHLMTRSMVSAQVAAVTAELDGSDREVAYLAGMLQNLGEVVVAHHSPATYLAIQKHITSGSARDVASVKEIGFTFDHLARVVAHHWKLSPALCTVWDTHMASSEVAVLARFGNELTRVMCLDRNGPRNGALVLLTMRYGLAVHLKAADMEDVWERALSETREMFSSLGVPFESLNPQDTERFGPAS